jgi:molybdate transport system substrate-binding protein
VVQAAWLVVNEGPVKPLCVRTSSVTVLALCALALSAVPVAGAAAAELQVLAGYAIAAPLQKLAAQFEGSSGDKLVFRFGTAPQLIDLIKRSASFDLVIVPSDVLKDSAARARLEPGPTTAVAHIGLAVAVRHGSLRPKISTREKFKRTLLQARSIATLPASATGARILQIIESLGIADSVRGKILAEPTPSQVVEAVASGKAELGLFLSNVLTAPGVDVVGPFPRGLQQKIVFAATVAIDARQPRIAAAFLHDLQGPAAAAVLRAYGVDPGK